jgi:Ser/Thr protein kinase RdoA (MazF antagonist)
LRRFSSVNRIGQAHDRGLLDRQEADRLIAIARRVHARTTFAHGDLTARNVLRDQHGLVLIDWEWGGLYPDGYELAFLWYSLVDVPGGRALVEAHIAGDPTAFFLSALVIQLWHLQWYVPAEHRAKHLATRDDLIARLLQ